MTNLGETIRGKIKSVAGFAKRRTVAVQIAKRIDASVFSFVDAQRHLENAAFNAARFIESMHSEAAQAYSYKYSQNSSRTTLYASTYACLSLSLLGKLNELSEEVRSRWAKYLDSFQSGDDGLWYDEATRNDIYDTSDWWGARHIALHLSAAYNALGFTPKHPFRFLSEVYDTGRIEHWLNQSDWTGPIGISDDLDNKIMNIGCLLQYQRDTWNDVGAAKAVTFICEYLEERINPETGMWGTWDLGNPHHRSRMVQFAYHLYPLYFYDGRTPRFSERVVNETLKTQNRFGGFGVRANSSACEDIDSIDILCRFATFVPERRTEIEYALKKALRWVLCNQVEDGGFVFRLHESFCYGHQQLSSLPNQGALLPTWFRLLSLAYLARFYGYTDIFSISHSPGYEF